MIHRSVLTTQSKLTVPAPGFGERGSRQSAVRGALAAARVLARCPVFGVGRWNGSLLSCLRKDVTLSHTASLGLGRGTGFGGRHINVHRLKREEFGKVLAGEVVQYPGVLA